MIFMAKRDRELIWPFQNSEDILWSPGLRKYFLCSKGICVPFLSRAEEDEGTTAFGDHKRAQRPYVSDPLREAQ
jgi:hypothetical protein